MRFEQDNNETAFVPQDMVQANDSSWNGRAIMLLDLDAFFASVEQLDHPAWRGKPVIVGGSADARDVVSTCSYEARTFGVRSAMAAATARRLCPQAIWTPGRFSRYREVSRQVMAIMESESPFIQQVSVDEAFLDITPTAHRSESPVSVAMRIQRRVHELGVTCSIGLGVSKAVAKTASEADKPRGITVVYPGREAAFLAPLPTSRMSGIGPVAQAHLKEFGITTLGQVAAADPDVLRRVFGKNAEAMRARCLGADTDGISAGEPVKQVSNEISFAHDLTERADIEAALGTVAAKVGRRLRLKGMAGSTVSLKIRYANLNVRSAQKRLPGPTNDEYVIAAHLRSMLCDLWHPGTAVRLVGCGISRFDGEAPVQDSLFELEDEAPDASLPSEEQRENLKTATDMVRDRFGEYAVQFGREMRTRQNLTGSSSKNPADYK
jgi:DNA polymerase-4